MLFAFFGFTLTLNAKQPDPDYDLVMIRDQDLVFKYNNTDVQFSQGWTQLLDGWMIYDYYGQRTLDDQGHIIQDGDYEIRSNSPQWKYLKLGWLEFDIYNYYYEFELILGTNQLTLYWNDTNDPAYMASNNNTIDIVINGNLSYMDLRIYNSDYASQLGYVDGYTQGEQDGYSRGLEEGQEIGETIGFNEGTAYMATNNISLLSIFQLMIGVVLSLFGFIINIEILGGISLAALFGTAFGIVVIVWILKSVRG